MKQISMPTMNEAQAIAEANRCLKCYDAPCSKACPAGIDVPRFVHRIATGDWIGAAQTIKEGNPLGFVCGQVCPSATLCQENCNCGKIGNVIPISALQAYTMMKAVENDASWQPEQMEEKAARVAIIGGGPSGVTAAALLRKSGYQVTLFEKSDRLGGVPMEEIPNNRLDKQVYMRELEQLLADGVVLKLNTVVDETLAAVITKEYDAVYLACGLGNPRQSIQSDVRNIYTAERFLQKANSDTFDQASLHGTTYIQGGGNTAIDAAMTAKHLGAERVLLCYRRSQKEMPAWKDERLLAIEAGVEFLFQTQITGITEADGILNGVTLAPVALGAPDTDGRRKPIVQNERQRIMEASLLITATGKDVNALTPAIFKTSEAQCKLFIGGDAANGGETVVRAVAEGKASAAAIENYLSGKN
ncbi:MAG: FAD-dependent oxidoreductase [Clostridia bacterium]